jgi:hypothetical protein
MESKRTSLLSKLGTLLFTGFVDARTPEIPRAQQVNLQEPQQLRRPTTQQVNSQELPTTSQLAWISINDQKPELYKKVIIYTDDKEILYNWARVNNTDYIHSVDNRTINNVTHWITIESPLEPPQNPKLTINPKGPRLPR